MSAPPAHPSRWLAMRVTAVLIAATRLLAGDPALGAIAFTDVTAAAQIDDVGPTWGAAWGDIDGDGAPDLWLTNHARPARLYRNQGDGTFAVTIFDGGIDAGDTHGAAWADFDHDGDQDLVVLSGAAVGTGSDQNRLLVNEGGVLTDRALEFGVGYGEGRGRMPMWLDWNRDGRLDLLITNNARADGLAPTAVFEQRRSGFVRRLLLPDYGVPRNQNYAQLGDLDGDGHVDLGTAGWPFGYRVVGMTETPFVDRSAALGFPFETRVRDSLIGDFDGDARSDLLLVRGDDLVSQVVGLQPHELLARVVPRGDERGIDVVAGDSLRVAIPRSWHWRLSEVYVGSTGLPAPAFVFDLSAANPDHHGIAPHTPGERGIWIGYDPAAARWRIRGSGPAIHARLETQIEAPSFVPVGWVETSPALPDRLYVQTPSGLVDRSVQSGVDISTPCAGAASGDFDNDGDLDFYLVCTDPVVNLPNRLYENLGGGVFQVVPGAGGAAGSSAGVGETATRVDFDGDGFLDLFLTNGRGDAPFSDAGPQQLLRNLGNDNHWLTIDLEGTRSNRDGIGARVFLTAGGVTQLRERGNETRFAAQDHGRVHFGLGPHTVVDELRIEWPSGGTQVLRAVAADQHLHVVEAGACANGIDDDGDGWIDHPADPGCPTPHSAPEDPACDDGIDNDADGWIDFADPECVPGWPYWESWSCGLGWELALPVPLIALARRRRRSAALRAGSRDPGLSGPRGA